MKDNGLVTKSKKRKFRFANAMWHVEWHFMKDPHIRGLNLVSDMTCVAAAQLFTEATSENAVAVLGNRDVWNASTV